ncbi:hypothetical protein B0H15DRAFT_955169 [Mycena belliarum]|uniref:Uncharacterized protein n=1 Tax=Mycena belliarum TaxID=1033014 RepID=A0AAD6TV07_9AGAR|nr:hypothetical protein B0H15DRAFT_955169 [Mycena belliae]
MDSPASAAQIMKISEGLIYDVVGLVAQTFIFGIYSVLVVLSTRMLLKRGLNSRVNKVMFAITTFMYLLSSLYWVYSVDDVVDRMKAYNNHNYSDHDMVTKWSPLFNAILLINYTLSDGIVVWRAWILCLRNHRKYLGFTIFFLGVTAVSVTCTIIFRIIVFIRYPITFLPDGSYLKRGIDVLQVTTLGMSLLSNLSATAVVAATLLRHRERIHAAFTDDKKSTKGDQILILLVESGVLYCVSGLVVLVSTLIRLPHGTLGDIYTPIAVQIAGAYPSVVLLLVSMQRSLNDTTFLDTFEASTPSRPIQFAPSGGGSGQNRSQGPVVSIQFARSPGSSVMSESEQAEAIHDNSHEKV